MRYHGRHVECRNGLDIVQYVNTCVTDNRVVVFEQIGIQVTYLGLSAQIVLKACFLGGHAHCL